MIDFSIVIPTRNRPYMLRRALASALNQTHDGYEVIVVDDASDHPVDIDGLAGHRLTLLRTPRRIGAGGARNFGAAQARGFWIAFLDDDDEYEPDFLKHTQDRLQAAPQTRFSWCSATIMHYDGRDHPIRESTVQFPESYESEDKLLATAVSVGAGVGFVVNRNVFETLGGFDPTYLAIEDTELFFRLIAAGHRPTVVAPPLVRIHWHDGPRLTQRSSYARRIRECERLRDAYADLVDRYPGVNEYLRFTIDTLTRQLPPPEPR